MSFLKINRAFHRKVLDADIAYGADQDEMWFGQAVGAAIMFKF